MLTLPSTDHARRLREFLTGANYTQRHFETTPVLRELPARSGQAGQAIELTAERSTLNALLRWFFLGMTQAEAIAGDLIPADILEILTGCGLLQQEHGNLVPMVMLTPCDDSYFAADLHSRDTPDSVDTVLWPNPTTKLLSHFSVQRHSRATLDLGAGCGILGILAKPFSQHVTATDLNPRAAEFTQFNAHLNGVPSIESLTGDTFEPVAGRKFDLILANPPFFVTPTLGRMYCENEMDLDQYCRRVVREAAGHLNEGGFFQAVLEWVQVAGQSWQDRLAEWLEDSGCDAWVLRTYARDGAGYARERIKETFPNESYSDRLKVWMDYYRERGVEEIHGGVLAMRRRSGRNWVRIEGTAVEAVRPFGDLVLNTFATEDVLRDCTEDEHLLLTRPRLPEGVELEQRLRMAGGKWTPSSLRVVLTGAAPAESAVEREVAGFLGRCDGTRTVCDLADELAGIVKVAREDARRQCCQVVRTLASRRILHLAKE